MVSHRFMLELQKDCRLMRCTGAWLASYDLYPGLRARASSDVRKDQRTGEGVSADIGIGSGGRGG